MADVSISPRRPRRRMVQGSGFVLAIGFLSLVVLLAILADLFPIAGYTAMGAARLAPPSAEHWFGTDEFGRDLFSRVVYAVRTSLLVALIGVGCGAIAGVVLGLFAGFLGGFADTAIMRFLDGLLAFPSLILAIGVTAVVGPGIVGVSIALAIVGVPQMARIVRSATLTEKDSQYVEGARAVGVSTAGIMIRHVIPNIAAPIMVQMALFFVVAVLTEAGLSFLGLGVQVPLPSLGSMLDDARSFLGRAPWYALAPGMTLTLIVLALNTVADGLSDRLDPQR